jgi:hypothetical protein
MIFFLIFLFLFGINVSQVNNVSAFSVNMEEINSQNMLFELNEAEDKENFALSVSTDSGQSEDQIQNNQEKEEIPVVNSHNIDSTPPFEEKKLETVDLSNPAGINQEKKEIPVNSHNIDGTPPPEGQKLEKVDVSNPAATNQEKKEILVNSKLINLELFNNSFFKNKEEGIDYALIKRESKKSSNGNIETNFIIEKINVIKEKKKKFLFFDSWEHENCRGEYCLECLLMNSLSFYAYMIFFAYLPYKLFSPFYNSMKSLLIQLGLLKKKKLAKINKN